MITYRLDIRNGDKWVYAFEHGELELVQACRDRRPAERGDTGYRIYKSDRKRLKKSCELAGAPKPCRKQSPGTRSVADLAKDAAEHIVKTKQKTIHVYPLGKTGSNVSNQFRKHLFGQLTGRVAQWWTDVDRVKSEAIAVKEFGYIIIEVDPAEWVFTPDLEEAA